MLPYKTMFIEKIQVFTKNKSILKNNSSKEYTVFEQNNTKLKYTVYFVP